VDWGIVVLLALIGGAVAAPLAAAVTSVWPSRATRWAARACLTMVVVAVVLLAASLVEHRLAGGGGYRDESGEYIERGDDSGVVIFMSAAVVAAGLVNLVGWRVANARTPMRRDRPPPPPPSTPASGS
jgi:hypothetical protein